MASIQVIAHLKTEENREYLYISSEKRKPVCGGNQGWWEPAEPAKKVRNFARFRKEKDFRMAKLGCGVIAMCDLQCYLTGKTVLAESQYREYVREESEGRYRIGGDLFHYITGLTPYRMKKGFRDFANRKGLHFSEVQWAPFWLGRDKDEKTLDCIREMLRGDIPVICSYHTFQKSERLALYSTPEEAAGLVPGVARQYVDSHYMTVVGVSKVYENVPNSNLSGEACCENWNSEKAKYILEIISWGSLYYVSYEAYARRINYFSNILKIAR